MEWAGIIALRLSTRITLGFAAKNPNEKSHQDNPGGLVVIVVA